MMRKNIECDKEVWFKLKRKALDKQMTLTELLKEIFDNAIKEENISITSV